MKKSITKINPKAKEKNKNNTKLFITIQFILTILLLVFGILSLIYKDLFFYFKLLYTNNINHLNFLILKQKKSL